MEYRIFYLPDATEEELHLWTEEMDSEKQLRLERFRRPADRLRCLCADHLARQMLSDHLGIPRKRLHFAPDAKGKPFLIERRDIYFNLSHAGDYALCAIDSHPIGVDIEVPRFIRPELCGKVCSDAELAYVHPNGVFCPQRFLALWTAKEAFFKHSGDGLRHDLRTVCLVQDDRLAFPSPLLGLFCSEAKYIFSVAHE